MTETHTAEWVLYIFTDPMMGLSYEQEPVLEKIREVYGEKLRFQYVMAGLVRDVIDFMTPEERALPPKEGIARYNKRLAGIYLAEEPLGGLPMAMEQFHLFDEKHRSSYPLDRAFEAVRLLRPDKAEPFLYALRRATIAENRQTTCTEELAKVAEGCGIAPRDFLACFQSSEAEALFLQDLQLTRAYGIHSLPSYLLRRRDREVLLPGLLSLETFQAMAEKIR